jgi:hypothetical protein
MAIQHNMLSTHIVCIAIHLLITDTFSTPTPVLDSYHSTNNGPSLHKGLAPEVIGISSYFAP